MTVTYTKIDTPEVVNLYYFDNGECVETFSDGVTQKEVDAIRCAGGFSVDGWNAPITVER